ncbi:RimJ/RimL family protein N-acetyltransferase [Nitrobacteraceae bacterium AZCC 1564]
MVAFSTNQVSLSALGRFTDVVRLRTGETLIIRFVTLGDGDALQSYFRSLSPRSRYNRLMGAASELSPLELDKTLRVGENSRFAVIAEMKVDGMSTVVGEARYSYDATSRGGEFGLSIGDAWQGRGIGSTMLANLECRSAALGAVRAVGETFRNNEQMIGLARKSGYDFMPAPYDWRQVRLEKVLQRGHADLRCESSKHAAIIDQLTLTALSVA